MRPEDDPEQWGQYYFRDTILDQLDTYWIYLKRMRRGDRDSYNLLRQTGIQLMPHAATRSFDKWRDGSPELSPWWHNNRPSFGAIAYGFDDVTEEAERMVTAELADPNCEGNHPEFSARHHRQSERLGDGLHHRPVMLVKTPVKYDRKEVARPRAIWTPRFLYFSKFASPAAEFEHVEGNGDTYRLTVYWDRCDKHTPKHIKSNRAGGVPQEYGLWIERGSGRICVLKSKLHSKIWLRWCRGPRGGKLEQADVTFVTTQWSVPDRYLRWAHQGPNHAEPEDYLRRMFIEAAAMFELAALGSMIRVAVSKNNLTAAFGVEIKRTPYFFKDRDVVLNDSGTKKRIFHIVRPHVRANGDEVPMHFRGLKNFKWANYDVAITVPGRDHFILPEFDVGFEQSSKRRRGRDDVYSEELGRMLNGYIKTGMGGMK